MGNASAPALVAAGRVEIDPETLRRLVRQQLGRPNAEVGAWQVDPVAWQPVAPTTAGLARVRGVARDGATTLPWSMFVKSLQSIRHWAHFDQVPSHLRAEAAATIPWRLEADLYEANLAELLPDGLRIPRLYHVQPLGDERMRLWMEDVQAVDLPWDLSRFQAAARLLGRLAARLSTDRLPARLRHLRGLGLRYLYHGRLLHLTLPLLRDPATWQHPLVAASVDDQLRGDLEALARQVPRLLDALDTLPQGFAHGDAAPQNLLIPADDPDGFVAIDWGGFVGPAPVGADLGQLLVGLFHTGQLDPAELGGIHEAILSAYLDGLREEALRADPAEVTYGYVATLVVRGGFSALPLELLTTQPTPAVQELFRRRAQLARFITDLALALPQPARR